MVSFKPAFSLSSFTFIKRLFSPLLSAISVVCMSEVTDIYLVILISACVSSSPAFRMMYSAYKLNKQGNNIQPWHTPFQFRNSMLFHSGSNSHFLTNRWGNNGNSDRLFSWGPKSLQMVTEAMKLKKILAPWKKSYDQPRQYIKKQTLLRWQRSILSKLWFFPYSGVDVSVGV